MAGQNKGDGVENKSTKVASRQHANMVNTGSLVMWSSNFYRSQQIEGDFQIMKSAPIFTHYVWPPTSLQLLSQGVSQT